MVRDETEGWAAKYINNKYREAELVVKERGESNGGEGGGDVNLRRRGGLA